MTNNRVTTSKERNLFRMLMVFAYASTLSFSIYFYFHDVYILAYNGFFCLALYLTFGILSYFTSSLLWLFRLSVFTAFHAFYFEIFFTGGALSPALTEFLIPPFIAFFYKPTRDRYLFMGLALVCTASIWLFSELGYTRNYFPIECAKEFNIISTCFVFIIVGLYVYMYRRSLQKKNLALARSYEELQATSQKLVESEKMASLGVLSAGVAHEINNPLNFIKGGIDVLSIQLGESKEAQPYVHAIDEGVKRATSIVNSLAHFSRNTPATDEVCDIHGILDNCLVMLNHRLKFKVEVVKAYDVPDSLKVIGNEGQLHQAMLNIISNAEQSITEKGTITIRTYRTKNSGLKVTISDTGCGIAPEDLTKIRDPFFTTKTSGEGTGLGLSITYKVIEQHDGYIEVASEISKGTDIHVIFRNPQNSQSA